MVVAGDVREGRFGQAESSMVIKKSLMALTTLPRLVGAGEEFYVPVTVFVDEKGVGDVTLELRLSDGLRSSSGGKARLKFTKPGQQTASFRVMAGEEPGFTKVEVVARGQGLESIASTNLEVRPATPWSNMVLTQKIEPGKTWEPSLTNDFMGTDLIGAVELSRLGNLGLENRLDELVRYPHGCLEQTVSKSFPQLYLSQLVDLAPESTQKIRDHIDEAMRKMNNFQSSQGGYGYWPVGGNPHPFGSLYGHFMLEAERLGYYWEPRGKKNCGCGASKRSALWQRSRPSGELPAIVPSLCAVFSGKPGVRCDESHEERWLERPRWTLSQCGVSQSRRDQHRPVSLRRDHERQGSQVW